jgi:hypothetical protein
MIQKQLIYWWQKLLHPIVLTICLAAGVLGIWGSNTPISFAHTALSTSVAVSAQPANPTKSIQHKYATVYRSPECTCCSGWINHLQKQGFEITDIPTDDIDAIKQKYNVPQTLASCHTAIVDGYIIEGHVPGADIKRLLQDKPNVIGLSVPQMPVGTPGMEMGDKKDPFSVLSFDSKGIAVVFHKYPSS